MAMVEELARNFIRLFLACYWLIAVEPTEPLSDFRSIVHVRNVYSVTVFYLFQVAEYTALHMSCSVLNELMLCQFCCFILGFNHLM
jgi:hypothetical protein